MFKKEDFTDNYLTFDDDFIIDENLGNQIILGPNGVGKSTIYKTILKLHPNYDFIDYEELKNDFIKNKNKLIIGAQIADLQEKNNEKNKLLADLHIKDNFKILNVTSQKNAKSVMNELNAVFVDNELGIETFNNERIEIINSLDNTNSKFLVSNYSKLNELQNIEAELDNLKNEFMKSIYNKLDKILDNDDMICPICGKSNDISIKRLISEKNSQLSSLQNELLKEYQQQNYNLSPIEIINNLSQIKSCINDNDIKKEDIISYYVCGGSNENATLINNSKLQFIQLKNEINELEQAKEQYYNTLKENEVAIKETFENKFNVSRNNIMFNDENKNIEITLPRNVDKYSTGEINLMVFTFSIYQFIASDKEVLIVDDPLSSYDISNQYRIIFDLVEATVNGKKIIILSHNIDCVNIANSQHRGIFKYKYIEKNNGILYLKDINLNDNDSVLNISNLLSSVENANNKDKYFKLLVEREDDLNAPENLIFHYDNSYTYNYEGVNLTNEYFISLIDNLNENSINNDSFEQNAIDKIFYMTAIRVWIEKQFYENNPNDTSLNGKTFGKKLEYMFPRNEQKRWNGSENVTRKYLMSKKTMINQHNHYKSQILPFNYVLNITLDELKKELLDIKAHFEN